MSMIRVMLVDDHKVVRAGIRMLINGQADMEVVAEAESAAATLPLIETQGPDVLLLDLTLPGGGSLRLIETLSTRETAPHILVLTMHDDPAYARAALGAGATGYIVKTIREEELLAAVRAVHRGQVLVDLDDQARTTSVFASTKNTTTRGQLDFSAKLSGREIEVLRLLSQGHTNQAVAEQLDLSPKTVATYKARIADKLGLKTTAEFVKYAADFGMLGTHEKLT
jgi:two-component system, NarL family, response regulator NreC